MSKRGKSVDAALDDMRLFMNGQRDFEDGVLYSRDAPRLWQCGYHYEIRKKEKSGDAITLRERLLIKRVKPRFFNLQRGRAA